MIGMSVYTGIHSDGKVQSNAEWGYSYGLGWTSFCFAFVGGLVEALRIEEVGVLLPWNKE